jgi:hypothetical protein
VNGNIKLSLLPVYANDNFAELEDGLLGEI